MEKIAVWVTKISGSTPVSLVAFGGVLIWILGGLVVGFPDWYQMIINTGTTIITFLMVFLIQRAQNKEMMSVQVKLSELIRAVSTANNRMINVEDLTEDQINKLHKRLRKHRKGPTNRRKKD